MLIFLMTQLDNDDDKMKFTKLYDKYENKMYAVAMSILHSQTLAEDALHDSFVKVIRNFEKVKQIPHNEIESWLVIVVKNASLDIIRKESRLNSLDEDWDIVSNITTEGESEYNRLVSLIRSMPENYRTILEMKYVLEYNNIEIAKALGISENAVAARIYRCRTKLISLLKKEGFSYE